MYYIIRTIYLMMNNFYEFYVHRMFYENVINYCNLKLTLVQILEGFVILIFNCTNLTIFLYIFYNIAFTI